MATAGWWTGFSGLGALFLSLHDGGFLQSIHLAWPTLYRLAFYFMAAFVVMVMFFPKKAASEQALSDTSRSQNAGLKQSKQSKLENMDDTYWQLAQQAKPAIRFLAITLTLIPCVILIWLLFGAPSLAESLKQHALFVPGLFAIAVTPLILAIYVLSHPSNQLSLKQTSTSISSKSEQGLPNLLNDFSLRFSIYILNTLGKPFASFFQRCGLSLAIKILLFIFCFKIGEAFLGRMSVLFYKELGFSTTEIATYSKLLSWWVTIIVSLVGGWFTLHFGMVKGLVIAGIAMASSNCFFSVMAIVGPEKWIFVTTVIIDGITSAWSNVAFVAFISLLVDRNYSASQYALFASIGTMSRTVLSSASGSWVDALDGNWALFFIITALMVIPALFLLYLISRNASLQQALTTHQVSTTHRPAPND